MPNEYIFHYFDLRARGEPVRWVLRATGAKFVENTIPFSNWSKSKPEYEFGTLPVLSVNGVQLHQTTMISKFLGETHNLAPSDSLESARIAAVAETVHDVTTYGPLFFFARSNKKSPEEIKGHYDKFKSQTSKVIQLVEGTISKEGWIRSEKMTWADVFVAGYMDLFENLFDEAIFEHAPKLREMVKRIKSLLTIQEWLETRPAINPWERKLDQ